jgi:hypothetical protein
MMLTAAVVVVVGVVVVESACAVSAFVPGCVGGISNGTMGICCAKSKVRAGSGSRRQAGGRQEWQEWQGTRRRGGGGADYTVSSRRPGGGFGFSRQPSSLGAQQPEDPCNQASRILRLARARLLDWGATGARLGRDGGATTRPQPWRIEGGAATANTTHQVCYMACNGLQWHAMACSHQGDCSGGLAITAAPSCYRLLSPAISACHATLPLASSPSGASLKPLEPLNLWNLPWEPADWNLWRLLEFRALSNPRESPARAPTWPFYFAA